MHKFDDLSEVESIIERLPEMIAKLPRRAGEKEARYAHLFSGPVQLYEAGADAPAATRPDRIAVLEAEVAALHEEVRLLKDQFAEFRKQFE
jgi:uncharacterized protein YceH (UPF0502 family)